MAMTPEAKVKRKLTDRLKEMRVWYLYPIASGYSRAGIPDIVCCDAGLFIGIEVKSGPKAKLTTLQEMCSEEIRNAGGAWFRVHDDETITEVVEFIKARRDYYAGH